MRTSSGEKSKELQTLISAIEEIVAQLSKINEDSLLSELPARPTVYNIGNWKDRR